MEDFKNLVVQAGLTWFICFLGSIIFGVVFAGWILLWEFAGMLFR